MENEKDKLLPPALQAERILTYHTIELDLTAARTDHELPVSGNYLYVESTTDSTVSFSVRLNRRSDALIPMTEGRGIRGPFERIYVTNGAQAGKTCTIAFAAWPKDFEIIDQRTQLANINIDQVGGTASTGIDLGARITSIDGDLSTIKSYLSHEVGGRGTLVNKDATAAGAATAIIHTVTTGKTLILRAAEYSVYNGASVTGASDRLRIRDAADAKVWDIPLPAVTSAPVVGIGFATGIQVPALYDIVVTGSNAANFVHGTIHGFEI